MNKAGQYDEYQISAKDLRELPLEHVSAVAALSYVVSEVNALRRIFLSQSDECTGQTVIDEALNVQKLVILRTWSSKLFEIKEFLEILCSTKPLTDDVKLCQLALEAIADLKVSTTLEGYQVARDLRNEASSHYSFEAAKKNVPHLHEGALCNMYISDTGGNDFFPLGESVMFHGRLHRRWKNIPSLEERRLKFDQWIMWCVEANESLIKSHAKFSNNLIFSALGRNKFYQKNYWVPEPLVGHPLSRMTPVFSRINRLNSH